MPPENPTIVGTELVRGLPWLRWSDGRLLPVLRGGDGPVFLAPPDPDPDPDPDPNPDPDPDKDLGEGGKRALAAEREARSKAERDRKASDARAKAAEARLAELEGASKTDQEKAVEAARKEAADAARSELTAQLNAERIESALIRAASAKLADPQDAVVHLKDKIEVGDDGRPDQKAVASAIEQLLKDKPYLAAATRNSHGSADQGAKKNGQQKPATLSDAVAARYAGT